MSYIVYLSSGRYRDYSLDGIYSGDSDPRPFINSMVEKESNGKWKTLEDLGMEHSYARWTGEDVVLEYRLKESIRSKILGVLENVGFKKIDAIEIWSG